MQDDDLHRALLLVIQGQMSRAKGSSWAHEYHLIQLLCTRIRKLQYGSHRSAEIMQTLLHELRGTPEATIQPVQLLESDAPCASCRTCRAGGMHSCVQSRKARSAKVVEAWKQLMIAVWEWLTPFSSAHSG